jgi:3-oxoacyl-[acyl-carrier protein] reductase
MDLQLKGKTALVTGASAGIGRAIARGLAVEGAKLCIVARRRHMLEQVASEMAAAGSPQTEIIDADIVQPGAPQRIVKEATLKLGMVEILVNCAGGSRRLSLESPEELWAEATTLSYTSRRQLTQAVLPGMMERKWGRVINITGPSEPAHSSGGSPAKAALHAWAKGLSREIGKYGITINSVTPGKIMSEQIQRRYTEEERRTISERDIPIGRYGEPEELACLVVFLASPVAGYITGTVMPVDGGMRRYAF